MIRGIALNTFITVLPNALFLEITNTAAITANHEFLAMSVHYPTTTKHRFNPHFLVLLLYLQYVMLEVFKHILVLPAQFKVIS